SPPPPPPPPSAPGLSPPGCLMVSTPQAPTLRMRNAVSREFFTTAPPKTVVLKRACYKCCSRRARDPGETNPIHVGEKPPQSSSPGVPSLQTPRRPDRCRRGL